MPHGVSGSEEVPQLKNFAVSLPGWINQGVTEQRTHLKLYYCDMLGRPKLEPPIRPDAVEWEVEKMKEFVLNARPKTRLDAYPLLVITQDILQRVAMDKIKIVSDREASLQAELEKLLATIRDLEVQVREGKDTISKLKLGAMMSSARKGLEGEALLAKEHEERERALKEIQDMMQKSDAEKKALEEEAERLKKLLAEQRKQLENANRQIKIAQQQAEATMKQYDSDVKRKPGDLFASWTDADKKAILLEQLLNNSELLGHVGLDAISKAWTRDGSASKQLLAARLLKELHEEGKDVLGMVAGEVKSGRYEVLEMWERVYMQSMADDPERAKQLGPDLEQFLLKMAAANPEALGDVTKNLAMKFASDAMAHGLTEMQLLAQLLGVSEESLAEALLKKLKEGQVTLHVETQTEQVVEEEAQEEKPKQQKKKALNRKPLYATGAKNMPYDNVVRLIHEAYEVKILADQKDDANNRPRQSFTDFLRDFLVRKYGLKSIATKHLGEIVGSIQKHSDQSVIRLFGVISGMLDQQTWSPRTSDFVLNILRKTCDIEGRPVTTISEWLNGDKEAGISEDAAIFAASEVSTSRLSFMPISDNELAEIKLLPKNDVGGLLVHDFLLWTFDFLMSGRRRVKEGFMQLFVANDKNGDGVLEFGEFAALIKLIIPSDPTFELDERKVSALYDEAATMDDDDDDDSISKEAFAEMACTHTLVCPPEYIPPARTNLGNL